MITTFFPIIEGMSKKGEPKIFVPEKLFDYINGTAELYLSYDFKELAVQLYEAPKDKSLSIEIAISIQIVHSVSIAS